MSMNERIEPAAADPDWAAWIDGSLCSGREAAVPVWDRAFLYGDGCFEGMRVRDGLLFRPQDHLARLGRSAAALDVRLQWRPDQIIAAIAQVMAANELTDAHVRVIVSRGASAPGGLDPRQATRPRVVVIAYPLPLRERPARIMISSITRKAPRSVDAGIKSLNSLDAILAKQQAIAAGMDDAFMLDGDGTIAEATTANVFVVRDGRVATPTTRAALPGITRRTVIELLREADIEIVERDVTWGELYCADECFLTGTAAGIVPVAAVDGREPAAAPGAVTTLVRDAFQRAVARPDLTVDLTRLGTEPAAVE